MRHRNRQLNIEQTVAFYKPVFDELKANVQRLVNDEIAALDVKVDELVANAVPEAVARTVASMNALFSALDIIR